MIQELIINFLTRLCSSDSNFCVHNNNYIIDNVKYHINLCSFEYGFFVSLCVCVKSPLASFLFQQLIKCYFNDDDDDLTRDFKILSALT